MAEAASLNSNPELTLEQKFSALETKFAALERRQNDLHETAFTLSEKATGKSTEIAIAQLPSASETTDREDATERKETRPVSRAKILINRNDSQTGERKDYEPFDPLPATPHEADTSHAFMLRKSVYDDAEDNEGEIDIISIHLWGLLKGLLSHYPYHIFQGPPTTLYSPYEPLVRYWVKLEQAVKDVPKDDDDKQARSDLKLLLDTLSSSSGDFKLDKYFKIRDSNKEQKTVTFDTLWTIFPPGTLVYGQPFQSQDQVLLVQDGIGNWPYFRSDVPKERASWSMLCWIYDWDGTMFRRMCLNVKFEYFEGQKPITSLPFYPFELKEQHAVVKEELIKLGRFYRQICTPTQRSRMFEYNGEANFVNKGFSGLQGDDDKDDDGISRSASDAEMEMRSFRQAQSGTPARPASVDSRVMVDFESYFRYGPIVAQMGSLIPSRISHECGCIDCRENEALKATYRSKFDEEARQKGEWEDEQYMLCPPRVLGYILREKQWAQLQVSMLRSIPDKDPNDSWSNRLELADGDKTKNMILNLVKGHGTSDPSREDSLDVDDIIARKGKGLVILLYGPPGVGKTSTAETVAIAARKPLFSISVADVGTKAKNVEANLAKIFALAASWQAILLIDEADVFLESRGKGIASNTERNALVSVFLRVLEYYQGILMLTTNQIAQFDVAVQSRIHVAIKYVDLNAKQTMAIFRGFLQPLDERGLVKDMTGITDWLEEDVMKMGLDGRQIRNILTSALGLARAQGKDKLEQSDIKKMLSNVKEFKDEFIKQFQSYRTEQGMKT